MDMKDLDKELRKYIKARFLHGDGNKLTDNVSLFESGIVDSLGILHLVSFLEEKFNVKIEDEEMIPENFETINKLIVFIRQKNGSIGIVETICSRPSY